MFQISAKLVKGFWIYEGRKIPPHYSFGCFLYHCTLLLFVKSVGQDGMLLGVFDASWSQIEPTVVVLIDRRHGNWSSVDSILRAINDINVSQFVTYVSSVFSALSRLFLCFYMFLCFYCYVFCHWMTTIDCKHVLLQHN